ncbi:MAG: nitroreductase family protein [Spirochaetales bacterium]|jgi:nitroreductase|nr:nitroreductase family protein [Spirochaetales bacterium]
MKTGRELGHIELEDHMLELLAKRRSIRKYTEERVSEELIEALTEAALYSASSRSLRPWEIVVVNDKNLIEELSKAKARGSSFLAQAPLAFAVVGIPEQSDVWIEDTSIVSSNLLLEAEYLGLGACWIQIRNRFAGNGRESEKIVKELLGLPDDRTVESIIAVGYPNESKQPYTREELHWEKAHRNTYKKHATR